MGEASSQAKGTKVHFVPSIRNEVDLVPLAWEDMGGEGVKPPLMHLANSLFLVFLRVDMSFIVDGSVPFRQ